VVLSRAVETRALGGAAQQGVAEREVVTVALAEPEPPPQAARASPGAVPSWAAGESELAGHSAPGVSAEQMSAPVSASACAG